MALFQLVQFKKMQQPKMFNSLIWYGSLWGNMTLILCDFYDKCKNGILGNPEQFHNLL